VSDSDYTVLPQGEGQRAVSCERRNQLAGSIKDRELRNFFLCFVDRVSWYDSG